MCRVLGWAGEISSNAQHRKVELILKGLILAEEKENPHGTGLATFSESGHQLVKKGMRGATFLLQGHADFLRYQKRLRAVLGHVRFKTSGEQSDQNAHPFGFRIRGDWHFGMHNGVIGCANELARKYGIKKQAVDSATFFHCLAKVAESKGLVAAIEEVTNEASLTGDFAFAMMRRNEIYLWRNESRPLCIFDLREEGLGRFFCSTKEMFEKALSLSRVSLKNKIKHFEAEPYRLYKVGHNTSPKLEVEAIKDLKHKEKPRLVASWWGADLDWLWQPQASCCAPKGSSSLGKTSKKSSSDTPSLFKKRSSKVDAPQKADFYYFISSLTDEQLEAEILATEAEVYNGLSREELKPYLNALYAEWDERRLEDEGKEDNL